MYLRCTLYMYRCTCTVYTYMYALRGTCTCTCTSYSQFTIRFRSISCSVDMYVTSCLLTLYQIEEMVLSSLAWRSNSPLFDAIDAAGPVPAYKDVALPTPTGAGVRTASLLMHPRLRSLSGAKSENKHMDNYLCIYSNILMLLGKGKKKYARDLEYDAVIRIVALHSCTSSCNHNNYHSFVTVHLFVCTMYKVCM